MTGYIGGTYGRLFKTTNGGYNWAQQITPLPMFVSNFGFCNDSVGWCAGGGGGILHTTNGGTYVGFKAIINILPNDYELYQNYPNPFNSKTTIEFDIAEEGNYTLVIYDILGRKVDDVLSKYLNAGKYKINFNANQLSSGVYFYKLSNFNTSLAKKFILNK
jgi:hypothetical protein